MPAGSVFLNYEFFARRPPGLDKRLTIPNVIRAQITNKEINIASDPLGLIEVNQKNAAPEAAEIIGAAANRTAT